MATKKKSLGKNPTMFSLLKHGCKIIFPSGYSIKGNVQQNYIDEMVNDMQLGIYAFEKDALKGIAKARRKEQKKVT